MRMDQDDSSNQGSILSSKGRRDTIAGFFNENDSSPVAKNISSIGLESNNESVNMEISSPVVRDEVFLYSKASTESTPVPVLEKKQSSRTRDSIACFFESPKYRSIVKTRDSESNQDSQEDQETDSCVEMETSSLVSSSEEISGDMTSQNESSPNSSESQEMGNCLFLIPEDSLSRLPKSKMPSPKSSRRSSRRYSMSPSPLKEKSNIFC